MSTAATTSSFRAVDPDVPSERLVDLDAAASPRLALERRRSGPSLGVRLRSERIRRQLSIEELAQTTRIPVKMLVRIEDDRLDELPGEVFVRGFVRAYARELDVDVEAALSEVTSRPAGARAVAPAQLPSIAVPERGRRFGIAIALVILLILFTLALSIVLRPRHRDTPIELSCVGAESPLVLRA